MEVFKTQFKGPLTILGSNEFSRKQSPSDTSTKIHSGASKWGGGEGSRPRMTREAKEWEQV